MKYSGSDHYCGGSLVRAANGEIVVVTAAHCMDKYVVQLVNKVVFYVIIIYV